MTPQDLNRFAERSLVGLNEPGKVEGSYWVVDDEVRVGDAYFPPSITLRYVLVSPWGARSARRCTWEDMTEDQFERMVMR